MLQLIRTTSSNSDFIALVELLDEELVERDGDLNSFYDQFNKVESIKHIIVAYENQKPISCGALKEYNAQSMEIKRMYTVIEQRGKGIASQLLAELEKWAAELGYATCILETGKKQVEAVSLYKKNGYQLIENYGQYKGVDNSLCFEKKLNL
ncbi:MAG: GNAT family N-acetyltransferase [Bacteroidia bacterium]|nr:GNAT family N-acetyltransferase [Bacteroidia bacterium]NNC84556.1 GNAT family N-acetyltransferase [Bacteroidia bacterium]